MALRNGSEARSGIGLEDHAQPQVLTGEPEGQRGGRDENGCRRDERQAEGGAGVAADRGEDAAPDLAEHEGPQRDDARAVLEPRCRGRRRGALIARPVARPGPVLRTVAVRRHRPGGSPPLLVAHLSCPPSGARNLPRPPRRRAPSPSPTSPTSPPSPPSPPTFTGVPESDTEGADVSFASAPSVQGYAAELATASAARSSRVRSGRPSRS